jgi:hypothetical protein
MEALEKLEDKELLKDLFVTAIEGGINYWSNVTAYKHSIDDWFATIETEDVSEDAREDEWCCLRIDENTIMKGMKLFAKELERDDVQNWNEESEHAQMARYSAALISSNGAVNLFDAYGYDVIGADCIVQMGLFGEVIYG